jgi:hypothetical protein
MSDDRRQVICQELNQLDVELTRELERLSTPLLDCFFHSLYDGARAGWYFVQQPPLGHRYSLSERYAGTHLCPDDRRGGVGSASGAA